MEFDTERMDQAVLALLFVGMAEDGRNWKSYDWDVMDRLHKAGFISNPVSKAKSVVLTPEGRAEAERLAHALFGRNPGTAAAPRPLA